MCIVPKLLKADKNVTVYWVYSRLSILCNVQICFVFCDWIKCFVTDLHSEMLCCRPVSLKADALSCNGLIIYLHFSLSSFIAVVCTYWYLTFRGHEVRAFAIWALILSLQLLFIHPLPLSWTVIRRYVSSVEYIWVLQYISGMMSPCACSSVGGLVALLDLNTCQVMK